MKTEIVTITRYKFDGKEYNSLNAVKTAVEDRLGAIIDKFSYNLSAKEKLNIMKIIIDNKAELRNLISITFTIEGERFNQDQEKNILDL